MHGINLLPWRHHFREKRKQKFFTVLGSMLMLAFVVIIFAHFSVDKEIQLQENTNKILQTEINLFKQKIKRIKDIKKAKNKLLDQINLIQQLRILNAQVMTFYDRISQIIPTDLYLENITKHGKIITIQGKAKSNIVIAKFLRRVKNTHAIRQAKLHEIIIKDSNEYKYLFTMSLKLM